MASWFTMGKQAKLDGKQASDNPFIVGWTKLGAPKLSEQGIEWEQGFNSIGRTAGKKEVDAARSVEVSKFKRKSNNYYK